jgi:hypothetical protein
MSSMSSVLDRALTPSPEVLVRVVGEESVVLDMESGKYLGMNEVGTRIWQLVSDGATGSSAITVLMNEFDVDEPTLRSHTEAFLTELLSLGLVTG